MPHVMKCEYTLVATDFPKCNAEQWAAECL